MDMSSASDTSSVADHAAYISANAVGSVHGTAQSDDESSSTDGEGYLADFSKDEAADDAAETAQQAFRAAAGMRPQHLLTKRGRGRPLGSSGSAALRQARDEIKSNMEAEEMAKLPTPGSIAYARQKKQQKVSHSSSVAVRTSAQSEAETTALSAGLLGTVSSIWAAIEDMGTALQQHLALAAQWSWQKQGPDERASSTDAKVLDFKQAACLSDMALKVSLDKADGGNTASRQGLADRVLRGAGAAMLGGGLLWSGLLQCMFAKIQDKSWKGLHCVMKMRYDETPLRLRVETAQATWAGHSSSSCRPVSTNETSEQAKIMQVECSIHCLLEEVSSSKRLVMSGMVPTTLQCVDRTTAECIKKAVLNTAAVVPDFERLSGAFERKIRVAAPRHFTYVEGCLELRIWLLELCFELSC